VNIHYNLSPYKEILFDYKGNPSQPSASQLQPIQNNNDPLHIILGNPNLRPIFIHNASLLYQNLSTCAINIRLNYGIISNNISTRTYTDIEGRQLSQQVNTKNSETVTLTMSSNKQLKPITLDFGTNMYLSYGQSFNYINNSLNHNNTVNTGTGISLAKYEIEKYSFQLNGTIGWVSNQSSLSNNISTHYFTQDYSAQLSLFPIRGLEVNSSWNYSWKGKIAESEKNSSTIMWHLYVNKNILKNQIQLRWLFANILGQNDISRSVYNNISTETRSNAIGRNWMISAIFRFSNNLNHH